MKTIKLIFYSILFTSITYFVNAQNTPPSFADLAEKLMPSVVNITTTKTVETRSNPLPGFKLQPRSPFEDMFKEFGKKKKKKE